MKNLLLVIFVFLVATVAYTQVPAPVPETTVAVAAPASVVEPVAVVPAPAVPPVAPDGVPAELSLMDQMKAHLNYVIGSVVVLITALVAGVGVWLKKKGLILK